MKFLIHVEDVVRYSMEVEAASEEEAVERAYEAGTDAGAVTAAGLHVTDRVVDGDEMNPVPEGEVAS